MEQHFVFNNREFVFLCLYLPIRDPLPPVPNPDLFADISANPGVHAGVTRIFYESQIWIFHECRMVKDFRKMDLCPDVPMAEVRTSSKCELAWYMVYDIETTTQPDGGPLTFLLGVCHLYNEFHQIIDDKYLHVSGGDCAQQWVTLLFQWLDEFNAYLEGLVDQPKARPRFNILGYNSARFDDVFIVAPLQKELATRELLHHYTPLEKAGSLIGNTFRYRGIETKFVDVIRYIGAPASLRSTAQGWGVDQLKGFFPMKLLQQYREDDWYLDEQTGYFKAELFTTREEYDEGFRIWQARYTRIADLMERRAAGVYLTRAEQMYLTRGNSVRRYGYLPECALYCDDDVKATWGVWCAIETVVQQVCRDEFDIEIKRLDDFHGAPSLMKCIALTLAKRVLEPTGVGIHIPIARNQALISEAIYGAWVGCHYQGVLTDEDLVMVDIVSHYPCSVTGPMPVGPSRPLGMSEGQRLLDRLRSYTLETLPIFFVRCEAHPPVGGGTYWLSSLPMRKKEGLLWGHLYGEGVWSSVHLWIAAHFENWTFTQTDIGCIYDRKEILYRAYVDIFGAMKRLGKEQGNAALVNFCKIAMNSFIGKLVERALKGIFKMTPDPEGVLQALGTDVRVTVTDMLFNPEIEMWQIHGKKLHFDNNYIPIQHGCVMYGYSHYIRMAIVASLSKVPWHLPNPIYGDTDSFVTCRAAWVQLQADRPGIQGKDVGGYNATTADFDFHVDLEAENIRMGCFLGLKTYYLMGPGFKPKVRCKGFRQLSTADCCSSHPTSSIGACAERARQETEIPECVCPLTYIPKVFCYHCLHRVFLALESAVSREQGVTSRYRPYIIMPRHRDKPLYTTSVWPEHFLYALGGATVVVVRVSALAHTTCKARNKRGVGLINPYTVYAEQQTRRFTRPNLSARYVLEFLPICYPLPTNVCLG